MSKENMLKQALLNIVDALDAGTSTYPDEEEAMELIDSINRITNTKTKLSKYQACKFLHISRATFDNWVRDGRIPKGKKEQGFTELFWLKEDLIKVKQNRKNNG